jgi:molybdenum cofactor cytidylyltransferase/nicotine blue oxidoreductase
VTVVGLLLAAGAGSRMGRPKALVLDAAGEPWLVRGVRALRDGGCDAVSVVLGAAADEAARLLEGTTATVVVADDWADGQAASLRAGLTSLDGTDAEVAVVSLVDLPDVGADVVRRVVGAGAGPATLARATYDGTPGHPVVMGRDHWRGVLEVATGDRGARDYLASRAVVPVECGDLATGHDVDR